MPGWCFVPGWSQLCAWRLNAAFGRAGRETTYKRHVMCMKLRQKEDVPRARTKPIRRKKKKKAEKGDTICFEKHSRDSLSVVGLENWLCCPVPTAWRLLCGH